MTGQKGFRVIVAAAALALATAAGAQQTVSPTDIQRLQDQVYQANSDVSRLRSSDSSLAGRLESELDDVRDEVIYLKVKLRKEGSVNRGEYTDLRDKIDDLRSRARGNANQTLSANRTPASGSGAGSGSGYGAGSSSGVSGGQVSGSNSGSYGGGSSSAGSSGGATGGVYQDDRRTTSSESGSTQSSSSSRSAIPAGQEIDVRLQQPLSSDTAQVEDRFEATTAADLYRGSQVLIPAGSVVRGVISSVNRASRTDRRGELTLAFDQVTVNGRNYPMRGIVTQALQSDGIKGEIGRVGAGSAVGAIIGGIIGGTKGALLGVLIGGGGTLAVTEGKDVNVPAGTLLRVRLDSPPDVPVGSAR